MMQFSCLLIGSLLLLTSTNQTFSQSDDYYDYGDDGSSSDYDYGYNDDDMYGDDTGGMGYDDCSFYHDAHEANGECHHDAFPTETLDTVFNSNVKQCCNAHAYMFYDNCEVSDKQLRHKSRQENVQKYMILHSIYHNPVCRNVCIRLIYYSIGGKKHFLNLHCYFDSDTMRTSNRRRQLGPDPVCMHE